MKIFKDLLIIMFKEFIEFLESRRFVFMTTERISGPECFVTALTVIR